MKVSDFIFRFSTRHSRNDGLCRVRTFVSASGRVDVLLTEIGSLGTGHSVTNAIGQIRTSLVKQGLVPACARLVEHYEGGCGPATFDVVLLDGNGVPKWEPISLFRACEVLGCSEEEFKLPTSEDPHLIREAVRHRAAIDRLYDVREIEQPNLVARRLMLEDRMIPKSALASLIDAGASERALQNLESDLTLLGEVYGIPDEEYIAFSQYPVGDGRVDFVVFTGRSRMEIALIEIKGADFLLAVQNSYGKFASKVEEAAHQVRERLRTIYRDYESARRSFHDVRSQVEAGARLYGALLGPMCPLHVDPDKDVVLRCVVIAGRTKDDLPRVRSGTPSKGSQWAPIT